MRCPDCGHSRPGVGFIFHSSYCKLSFDMIFVDFIYINWKCARLMVEVSVSGPFMRVWCGQNCWCLSCPVCVVRVVWPVVNHITASHALNANHPTNPSPGPTWWLCDWEPQPRTYGVPPLGHWLTVCGNVAIQMQQLQGGRVLILLTDCQSSRVIRRREMDTLIALFDFSRARVIRSMDWSIWLCEIYVRWTEWNRRARFYCSSGAQ